MKKAICVLTAFLLLAGFAASGRIPAIAEEESEHFGQLTHSVLDGAAVSETEPDEEDPEENEEEPDEEDPGENGEAEGNPEENGEEPEEDSEDIPEEDAYDGIPRTGLVSAGTQVWRIRDGDVVCEDLSRPEEEPVTRSVEDVVSGAAGTLNLPLDETAEPKYVTLLDRDGESVLLCAALKDTSGEIRAILVRLTADEEEIQAGGTAEAPGLADVIFGKNASWRQVEMVGLPDAILICALDENEIYHVYRYAPDSPECRKLGYLPLVQCSALIPYGEDVLIVGPSLQEKKVLDLTVLSPAECKAAAFGTAVLETDAAEAGNIAFSETENMLYFTAGSIAFRVPADGSSLPVSIASMKEVPERERNGVIAGAQYVLCGESGELLQNDIHRELQIARIRVFDTTGSEAVQAAAAGCGIGKTQYYVTVSGQESGDAAAEETSDWPDGFDVYISEMSGSEYSALKTGGGMAELNAGGALRAGVADMPEYIRNGVSDGSRLLALPVAARCECFVWNTDAFRAVTGVSREQLPTDWTGFLELLGKISQEGQLNSDSDYTLCDSGLTAGELKEQVFAWILRDCLIWAEQDRSRLDELPAVMTPILQAFGRIRWSGLGLPAEKTEEDPEESFGDRMALLSVGNPEITETSMMEGVVYWPLSVAPGGERLIPQTVSVMWIRSGSAYAAASSEFLNDYWESMDTVTKMTLCQSMNEPVADIPDEKDPEEEEPLQDSGEPEESVNSAAVEETQWIASAQSIADYRSLAKQTVSAVPEFGSSGNEKEAVSQYLEGKITAEQFAGMLVSLLRMR